MSSFRVTLDWKRGDGAFGPDGHDRTHVWTPGSGMPVPASSAPDYGGAKDRVNPEEAFVGALASCHMLTFLAVAARKRLVVDAYEDDADAELGKNEGGRMAVVRVTLRPRVRFAAPGPSAEEVARMHETAHRNCFIANSVSAPVGIEPRD
jgi:organic hydroperoxide reductase OsmC/OhrA